jgi:hypothetical protein
VDIAGRILRPRYPAGQDGAARHDDLLRFEKRAFDNGRTQLV